MSRPTALLWLDAHAVHRDAIERAGLAGRVDVVTLRGDDTPSNELLARVDLLLGGLCLTRLSDDGLERLIGATALG